MCCPFAWVSSHRRHGRFYHCRWYQKWIRSVIFLVNYRPGVWTTLPITTCKEQWLTSLRQNTTWVHSLAFWCLFVEIREQTEVIMEVLADSELGRSGRWRVQPANLDQHLWYVLSVKLWAQNHRYHLPSTLWLTCSSWLSVAQLSYACTRGQDRLASYKAHLIHIKKFTVKRPSTAEEGPGRHK